MKVITFNQLNKLAKEWIDNATVRALDWHMSQPPLRDLSEISTRERAIEDFLGFVKKVSPLRK